jgi:hypothetical protein
MTKIPLTDLGHSMPGDKELCKNEIWGDTLPVVWLYLLYS